jgi:hypothetical protein
VKHGRVKKQHSRVQGLDEVLARILKECPEVTRIIPGRITVKRGSSERFFKVQYPTDAGLKCLYVTPGTVQEVFLVCSDVERVQSWLATSGMGRVR